MAADSADSMPPTDPMRDAEALGAWLLIEFPDGQACRFAYRPLYEVLPGRWLFVSPDDDDNAHIAPSESVQTLVSHRETSVSVVDEPSFLPGGDSDDAEQCENCNAPGMVGYSTPHYAGTAKCPECDGEGVV
jgi:hypothetical protein